jgi:MFS family permease
MSLLTGKTARGLTLLYASGVIAGMGWSMVLPIIPVFADEFDISGGLAAQIITGFALGRFFGTPVAGWLVDRFGSRIALFGGPLLAAAAAAVSALTPWFAVVIGAAFVVGFGDAVWAFGREIAGIDLVRLEQRGRADRKSVV